MSPSSTDLVSELHLPVANAEKIDSKVYACVHPDNSGQIQSVLHPLSLLHQQDTLIRPTATITLPDTLQGDTTSAQLGRTLQSIGFQRVDLPRPSGVLAQDQGLTTGGQTASGQTILMQSEQSRDRIIAVHYRTNQALSEFLVDLYVFKLKLRTDDSLIDLGWAGSSRLQSTPDSTPHLFWSFKKSHLELATLTLATGK